MYFWIIFRSNSLKLRSINPILSQSEVAQTAYAYGLNKVQPELKRATNIWCHYDHVLVWVSNNKIWLTFQRFLRCNTSSEILRLGKAQSSLSYCSNSWNMFLYQQIVYLRRKVNSKRSKRSHEWWNYSQTKKLPMETAKLYNVWVHQQKSAFLSNFVLLLIFSLELPLKSGEKLWQNSWLYKRKLNSIL